MDGKFIIVEGELDRLLLEAILPTLPPQVRLVAAGGYSAAISKAATVLSYLHQDTFLALDADTVDEQTVLEKQQFVFDYLKGSRNGNLLGLSLFKPTLLDYLTNYEEVIKGDKAIVSTRKFARARERVQEIISSSDLARYQELPDINRIIAFAQ